MARKIDRKPAPTAAEESSAADAIASLKPEASITVAGRAITVREYGFFEGLEVAGVAAAFIADMVEMSKHGGLRYAGVRRLFGKHQAVVVEIAARAADVEPEWVRSLKGENAELFMSTWFGVNSGFFGQEVVIELKEELEVLKLRAMASRSIGSSSDSPAAASAISTASAASPSDN